MQHIEHDMDELFQKAAESYPLNTSTNDWEAIASRLSEKQPVEKSNTTSSINWKKYFFATLFLFLMLLLADILVKYQSGRISSKEKHSAKTILPAAKLNENDHKKMVLNNDINIDKLRTSSSSAKNFLTEISTLHKTNLLSGNLYMQKDPLNQSVEMAKDHMERRYEILPGIKRNLSLEITASRKSTQFTLKQRISPTTNIVMQIAPTKSTRERGAYFGFLAGPQLNEVKKQGMTRTGLEFGLLAGYRFNNRISVESGLFYSTKYYYSDGKYFTMTKPDPLMPPNMVLMDLKGNSNVLEIPLKIRFDFVNNNRTRLFSSAGIASYILTKENNNYHAMVNGSPEYMARSYKNISHYAAAGIHFSAGVEHRLLNKRTAIRIEPYLQLPLKGIGVGAMPVTSAGLHIGITTGKSKQ